MAEELQSLLNKINAEGVKKAEAERDKIIAAAKADAAAIIADAKREAEDLIAAAEKEAASFQNRAVASAAQAARDIALQLREELAARLEKAAGEAAQKAFSAEFMAELIRNLAKTFAASPDTQISIRTAVKDIDALNNALKSALAESFSKAPKLFPAAELNGGFEVDFKDGKCYFDFTAEAVTELLGIYIGEQLAAIFKAEA